MPAYTVYVLRCRDGSLYTGIARDVAKRLAAHAAGRGSRCVAGRRPFRLVYAEPARSKSAALKREAAIKAMPRMRKLALVQALAERTARSETRRMRDALPSGLAVNPSTRPPGRRGGRRS